MPTLAKHSISLLDVGSSARKMRYCLGKNEIFCQSKVLFPFVHPCYKDMQHRSKHNSIIWAWRNRAKLKSLWYSLAQYNTIFHSRTGRILAYFYQIKWSQLFGGFAFRSCSFLLPDVQTWICTVHTQDLKPTVLPQYIDEMRSRSGMAKKNALSQSPALFFFPGAPFLGSKMGSEMVSSTL